jgi:hypothetical protein
MLHPHISSVSQTQRERLFHIDFRLYFVGAVNRNDLVSRFGIKEAAATRDLTLYKELAPGNLEYDTKAKTYIQRQGFRPLFEYNSNQALAALRYGFGDYFVTTHQTFVPVEAPTQLNIPSCDKLACITQAVHNRRAIKLEYHSLSSGLTQREIVPHVLVDNGLRWHVRGFDRKRKKFSDFVINRIEKLNLLNDGNLIIEAETKAADLQWNRIIDLHLVPHPKLKYPDTIEREYGMVNGKLNIKVRAAVAGYVLRRWNVDCSENHELTGAEYHLWLQNRQVLNGVENLILAPGYSSGAKRNLDVE